MFKRDTEENKELAELKKQCEEYLNGWKRAKADYENLKKDTEKKMNGLGEYATAGVILELIPVFNHLKLAIQHIPEDKQDLDWVIGILHIKREFEDFFKNYEISEIKTMGEKFNPEYHEAVSHEESEQGEDIILKEVQPGYQIKGKVFLPAKVIVSKTKDLKATVLEENTESIESLDNNLTNNLNLDARPDMAESSLKEE